MMTREQKTVAIQVVLLLVTALTTTLAGAEWVYGKSIYGYDEQTQSIFLNPEFSWADFRLGMNFSVPFLLILTVHEFGHYFVALYHRVKTSLPFYIPIPPIPGIPSLGTFGAVIRMRNRVESTVKNFDIGLAGPLAGFMLTVGLLVYGMMTLPPPDYIFDFHPEYKAYGLAYADHVYQPEYLADHKIPDMIMGDNLLFRIVGALVADPARIPNQHELMHYPVLLACFFALFFTCLNLLPIGQLDGGHITYGLLGSKGHFKLATVVFLLLTFYAGLNLISPFDPESWLWTPMLIFFYFFCFRGLQVELPNRVMLAVLVFAAQFLTQYIFPTVTGYTGYLLFVFLIGRVIGVAHPPAETEVPLSAGRRVLGWLALVMFILSIIPAPMEFIIYPAK